MTRKAICAAGVFTCCTLILNQAYTQTDTVFKPAYFSIGMGIVGGNEYGNTFKEHFSNATGFFGWINVEAAVKVRVVPRCFLSADFRFLGSSVKIYTPGFEQYPSGKANLILIPGVSAGYNILENRKGNLFASGGIGFSSCSSDFTELKFQSGGVAKHLNIGYEFVGGYKTVNKKALRKSITGIRVGMMWIPVKLLTKSISYSNPWEPFAEVYSTDQRDFGGISFTVTHDF